MREENLRNNLNYKYKNRKILEGKKRLELEKKFNQRGKCVNGGELVWIFLIFASAKNAMKNLNFF